MEEDGDGAESDLIMVRGFRADQSSYPLETYGSYGKTRRLEVGARGSCRKPIGQDLRVQA